MIKSSLINLPEYIDQRGSLSFLENNHHIPFEMKSVSWINEVKEIERRSLWCSKNSVSFMISISGEVLIQSEFNNYTERFLLNKPSIGLLIPKNNWIRFISSSDKILILMISSILGSENDIISKLTDSEV